MPKGLNGLTQFRITCSMLGNTNWLEYKGEIQDKKFILPNGETKAKYQITLKNESRRMAGNIITRVNHYRKFLIKFDRDTILCDGPDTFIVFHHLVSRYVSDNDPFKNYDYSNFATVTNGGFDRGKDVKRGQKNVVKVVFKLNNDRVSTAEAKFASQYWDLMGQN